MSGTIEDVQQNFGMEKVDISRLSTIFSSSGFAKISRSS